MKSWPNKLRAARIILDRACTTRRLNFDGPEIDLSKKHHLQFGYYVRALRPGHGVKLERPVPTPGSAIWKINLC